YRTSSYDTYEFDTFYFEKNLQGDIIAVYNEDGQKALAYTYDAWGNHTTTWVNRTLENMPAVYNPFRYRGYYYDTETQLYYLQSRYYNPAWGRFLNADGLVSTGTGILGYNMYTYCDNNPVMRTDYGGTNWFSDIWEKIKNFFSDNFGATASIGQEESEEIQLYLAKVETGIGYSKSFDTGKAANVYVSAGEDWKELDEYSAGFDVNINGYGANIEIGTDTSFGVHLNKISIDFGKNSTGNSYIQITSETENGEYAYTKFSINTWNCAVVALVVICVPYALPALAPALVGV
ncbi:MAG: RHS repeat-associated core domain-containing protein, partial [Clostridia bacterium]|nr:RHS repeat-associated core domain-containing protein [Clostridia bacterium]